MPRVQAIKQLSYCYKFTRPNTPPEVLKEHQSLIINYVKQGLNHKEIAEKLGIHCSTMTREWRKLNIDECIKNELINARLQGKSAEEIQKEWNWNTNQYYGYYKKYGIPLRINTFYKKYGTPLIVEKSDKCKEDQKEIISLIKQGMKPKGIAKELGISMDSLTIKWKLLDIENCIKDEIVNARLQGKSAEEIQKEWNWNINQYYKRLKRYDIPLKINDFIKQYSNSALLENKNVDKEEQEKIISCIKRGLNPREIAKELGISTDMLAIKWHILDIENCIKDEIINARLQGKSAKEIQKEWNWRSGFYYKKTNEFGISNTKKGLLLEKADEIIELRNQGKTKVEMAGHFGVTYSIMDSTMHELELLTLSKDSIQDIKKKDLLLWKQQYGSQAKISRAKNISYYYIRKLFKLFGLSK